MLKVANVIEEGRYAGPQARISSVAEKLKEKGIETVVVFPEKDSGVFYKKLSEKGIQIRQLSQHHITKQKSHLLKYFIFFVPELFSLWRLLKEERVDMVHCNGAWQIKGIIAARLSGAKVVWHLNDTQMPAVVNIVFKFLSLHFCDAFITAGERVKNYYLSDKQFSKKQIMVIQAPVDTSVFDPQKVKENPRIAQCRGIKIITIANISSRKGIDNLIHIASILNLRYEDLHFFVVGPHFESQKKYLKRLSQMVKDYNLKNFHFYGPSYNTPPILKAADIFVFPSFMEASPIAVWEAMAMAKPIVSTNVGDVAKFIKDGENGFIVPIKDTAAMAEKIGLLIENKELRRKFGRQARETAVKHLDVENCVKKHVQLYRKVMLAGKS